MRAVVVYESMYGNTHLVADAIVSGLTDEGVDAKPVPVADAVSAVLEGVDLIVVGGPTHAHAMSRESTRAAAVRDANKEGSELHLDPDSEGEGLREWFDDLEPRGGSAAAFDTRFHMAAAITGRASRGISKRLRRHGFDEVADPESFFVEKGNTLEAGEAQRARAWGAALARVIARAERTATA